MFLGWKGGLLIFRSSDRLIIVSHNIQIIINRFELGLLLKSIEFLVCFPILKWNGISERIENVERF